MKTSRGFEQCFNAQTAVDAQAQIIAAAELGNYATDVAQLPAMLAAVKRNTAQTLGTELADAWAITAKWSWHSSASNPAR